VPDSEQSGGNTARNTAGLRPPWKPGESGNLSGRPKRKPLTDAYAALLDKPIPPDMARQLKLDESTTYAQVIAMSMVREAVKGKFNAAAELADRVEGRVMERVQVDHRGDPLAELLSEFKREYEEMPKAEAQ
jgi:hypothetical protein